MIVGGVPVFDASGAVTGAIVTGSDVTAIRRMTFERDMSSEFLHIVNRCTNMGDLIGKAVAFFRHQSGCEAVGIRLRREGDYPYYEVSGFPESFLLTENSLCLRDAAGLPVRNLTDAPVLECLCGNVICGRTDPSKPFFTVHGSFWTNSTSALLASATDADRQARIRNRCNAEGYESVALVPLRVGEETLGLLQLNAIRPDRFTLETVEIWERLADHLAVAVAKFEAEEALRESERRFRSVLEDSLDCIYRLNLQTGRFEYVSPSAETIVGYGPNELMAQNTGESMDMVHPDDLPVMQAARERLEATGQVNAEYRQRTKNGEYRWLSNHMSLVRDIEGLPLYRNGSIRDVTEQKQAEEELIRQSEKLEAANRELDSFAYSVSHDLRAPLRAIDGYSRMVLKKLGDNLAGEAKEDFAVIRDSVRAMDRLIDDLLAFSRQGRQSMNLGPLDMRLLLWETWQELRSANRERTMTLNIESVPSGWGDKALLKQVFMNLLTTNAVKFTRNREDGAN